MPWHRFSRIKERFIPSSLGIQRAHGADASAVPVLFEAIAIRAAFGEVAQAVGRHAAVRLGALGRVVARQANADFFAITDECEGFAVRVTVNLFNAISAAGNAYWFSCHPMRLVM